LDVRISSAAFDLGVDGRNHLIRDNTRDLLDVVEGKRLGATFDEGVAGLQCVDASTKVSF
jgi:hypothetical protein